MCWRALQRRLRIFETNYGRNAGWLVERNGHCVAVLTNCCGADMFWDRYSVEWITTDPEERQALESADDCLWWGSQLQFRNREGGEIAENAFAAGPPQDGTVIMRSLYLPLSGPWPWEWLLLWWHSWRGTSAREALHD